MPGKRAGAAAVEERIMKVYQLLVDGARRDLICQFVAKETNWNVSRRMIDRYIREAWKEIVKRNRPKKKQALALAIARREDLYLRCKKVQDYKACQTIAADLAKLLGLYAPTKQEVAGPGGAPIMTQRSTPTPAGVEEIRRLILEAGGPGAAAAITTPAPEPPRDAD